jgi:phosphohistidine phosphatase
MRRLLLLRHAKAERSVPGGRDEERVLTDRGRTDAAKLGAYLLRHGLVPDLTLVSSAARTRETWHQAAAAFEHVPSTQFEERLYGAPPDTILQVIRETAPKVTTLLVVGHNPGLHEAAIMLVAAGDIDARQRLNEQFPTAALAVIEFAIPDWRRLHAQGGRLEHFVLPRSLAAAD